MNKNNIESIYTLTPMQEGLLYHSIQDKKQYLDQYVCKLSGDVNTQNLIKAWENLISENAILRTAFVWENVKEPLQVVLKNYKVDFPTYDWRNSDENDIQEKLQSFLSDELDRGFKLDEAPLTKLAFLRASENEYYFVWTIHHLIVDGMSLPQLLGQVYENYRKLCNNEPLTIHKALPFKAYVDWIKRQDRQKAVNYWTEYLKGFYEPTQIINQNGDSLPTKTEDRSYSVPVDEALVQSLQDKAKQSGIAVYQLYNLAYAIMLSKISDRNDVVYGVIVSGRPLDLIGSNDTIGVFINTVPTRVQFNDNSDMLSYLKRASVDQVERNKYEYLPLTDVVALSEVGSDLFQSLFIYENYSIEDIYLDTSIGFEISDEYVRVATNYPVSWIVIPGRTTRLNLLYKTEFIDDDSIIAFSKLYIHILNQLASNVEIPISQFKMNNDEEKATPIQQNKEKKALEMLKTSFAENKYKTALHLFGRDWTYEMLESAVAGVIEKIRTISIENSKMAVISNDSAVNIIAVLGAIKSGFQPVLPGQGLRDLDSIYKKTGLILTDKVCVKNIPEKYHNKCVVVAAGEYKKSAESYSWKPENDYSVIINSIAGEDTILGSILVEDYEELDNKTVMVDTDIFDNNFIILMMLKVLMNGSELELGDYSSKTSSECVFTCCESILNAGENVINKNVKLYLPLLEADSSLKKLSQNQMIGKDVEVNLFLTDIYTYKEIYSVSLKDRKVLKNSIEVLDRYENILAHELVGSIYFSTSESSQRINKYGSVNTGYKGKIKTDGTFEISLNYSKVGYICKKYTDYKITEKLLKEESIVEDIIIVNRLTANGELKSVLYYVDLTKNEEDLSSVETAITEYLCRLWGIDGKKLISHIDFCRMEALPYDREGCVSIRKLMQKEIVNTYLKNTVYEYIKMLNQKNSTVQNERYVIGIPKELEAMYRKIFSDSTSSEEKLEVSFEVSTAEELFRGSSLINDEYGNSCRCIIHVFQNDTCIDSTHLKPESETEKTIAKIWEEVLKVSDIGVDDNFFDLGGNSVAIMKVVSRTVTALKVSLTIDDLFNNPTVRKLSIALDECLIKHKDNIAEEKPVLSKEDKLLGVPASFAQQRFWFLHQYDNDDVFYNISEVVKITGTVDVEALRKTIHYLSQRQEVLRTVFYMKEGSVYQKVLDSTADAFSVIELSVINSGSVNKENAVNEFIENEIRHPFDFQNGPLFRCKLLKISETESLFIFVIHHIISDGWSVGIFINELLAAYQKYSSGQEPLLNDIQWQYCEYSIWQKDMLKAGVMKKQLGYWKDKLDDCNELNFPLDFERPAIQSFTGRKFTCLYPKQLMDKVSDVAKKIGTTTFMVYLSALNILISRYSVQEDILIGSPVTNRPMKEVENTIGCFLNTVVFRNKLTGNPTFEELIQRVRQTSIDAYSNQDIPFEVLVDKLGVKRDLSKNPLFQIMFLFQNEPHPDGKMAGLEIERLESENNAAMLDLSISMEETDNGVSVLYEYNTDLFRTETIKRISDHLQRIIDILCSNVKLRINDFNYMSEEEINHVIYGLNDTKVVFDTDLFIHQLFEEQAGKHPDREALRFRGQSLTYKELNIRINRLANYLLSIGIKKRQIIAVYMDRSVEMVVALYGILKAGAAYLPVDPEYPKDRIQSMLEDSNVEVVLTQEEKSDDLKPYPLKTITLGENDITLSSSGENPNVNIEEDDYAYMIYTSGSTGRPKGVINTHKGIRNRILWIRVDFPPDESGRQMQKTPFSFDVSCGELFGAMTVGACLVMAEPGGHKDVDYLIDLINQEGITHIHFVPSMLKPFISSPRISEVKGLRQVCCTGEPLPYSLVEKFTNTFNDCDIFNLYGPTEAAVEVTSWNCRKKLDRNIISIGTPMANTQIYILDSNLRPVPIGVCGELYIAGDNLAVGYHNREELTAQRFIPNPFSMGDNPIMYRTGDFARLLPGGEIDFIGRIDNQVKIRGNRIELGEIETHISNYSGISEVHVIVSKEETPRIIAYVVLEDKTKDNMQKNEYISGLRQCLREKLPEYMIPSFIMVLDEMPLLPNGKFDAKKMPLPEISREYLTSNYTEAMGDVEIKLKQIWSAVLSVEKIGIDDNFFEMGGHSLLLIEVYYKVKESFDTDLTVVDMFKYPTIRSLSEYISVTKDSHEVKKELEKEMETIRAGNRDRKRNSSRMKELRSQS